MTVTSHDLNKLIAWAKERQSREVQTDLTEGQLRAAGAHRAMGKLTYGGIWLLPKKRK